MLSVVVMLTVRSTEVRTTQEMGIVLFTFTDAGRPVLVVRVLSSGSGRGSSTLPLLTPCSRSLDCDQLAGVPAAVTPAPPHFPCMLVD